MNRLFAVLNAIVTNPKAAALLKMLGQMSPEMLQALACWGMLLSGCALLVDSFYRPREVQLAPADRARLNALEIAVFGAIPLDSREGE